MVLAQEVRDSKSQPEWPASQHRIASVFASWERLAEDFRSENAHRHDFASHRIAISRFTPHRRSHRIAARIARYGPLRSQRNSPPGPAANLLCSKLTTRSLYGMAGSFARESRRKGMDVPKCLIRAQTTAPRTK